MKILLWGSFGEDIWGSFQASALRDGSQCWMSKLGFYPRGYLAHAEVALVLRNEVILKVKPVGCSQPCKN